MARNKNKKPQNPKASTPTDAAKKGAVAKEGPKKIIAKAPAKKPIQKTNGAKNPNSTTKGGKKALPKTPKDSEPAKEIKPKVTSPSSTETSDSSSSSDSSDNGLNEKAQTAKSALAEKKTTVKAPKEISLKISSGSDSDSDSSDTSDSDEVDKAGEKNEKAKANGLKKAEEAKAVDGDKKSDNVKEAGVKQADSKADANASSDSDSSSDSSDSSSSSDLPEAQQPPQQQNDTKADQKTAQAKTKAGKEKVNEKAKEADQKEAEKTNNSQDGAGAGAIKKKAAKDSASTSSDSSTDSSSDSDDEDSEDDSGAGLEGGKDAEGKRPNGVGEPLKKKVKIDEQSNSYLGGKPEGPGGKRQPGKTVQPIKNTIFVNDLPIDAKEEDVKGFFVECGRVVRVRIFEKKVGDASSGLAFVEFGNEAGVEKAFQLDGNELLGKHVRLEVAVEKVSSPASQDVNSGENKMSVFVHNISFDATDKLMKEFFEDCGKIVNLKMVINKITGKFSGNAFIDFESESAASKAIEKTGQEFLSRKISVEMKTNARPTRDDSSNQSFRGGRGGAGRGFGGGRGRGGFSDRGGRGGSSFGRGGSRGRGGGGGDFRGKRGRGGSFKRDEGNRGFEGKKTVFE